MIRVFSGDGGGVFGTIPAYQLQDYNVFDEFDVLGGCSISSAIVAAYAVGMSGPELLQSMQEDLPKIFDRPWYRWMSPWGAKWPNAELINWCKKNFDIKLGEVSKPIFIVSMDFSNGRPKVFSNTDNRDVDTPLYDAVLASVSAPTYFAPQGVYVDGGLFANNPSVVTCAGACTALNTDMDQIHLFSIGTGVNHHVPINMKGAAGWGLLKWAKHIIPVMLEGGNEIGMDYIAKQLSLGTYVRSNLIDLEPDWEMDDASIIPDLIDKAETKQLIFKKTMDDFLEESK